MIEPTTTSPPVSFNLWRDPWIRVIQPDGGVCQVSIRACLAEAHILAALYDPSPLVVAGTHRLLVAILQAIYAPDSLDDIADVLRAERFDRAKLEGFAAQHAERFDLFHPTTPFLQTGDVPLDGWRKLEQVKGASKVGEKLPWPSHHGLGAGGGAASGLRV
jgi:CRISPR system Cascade subunit CasA